MRHDLWLLIDDGRDDARAALRRALEACGNLFARLSESAVSASIIPEVPLILCTDTPVLHIWRQARTAMGTTCLEALLQGEVGEEIKRHVRSGAIIAMARADTPKLQDHCVRALCGIRCTRFIPRSAAMYVLNTVAPSARPIFTTQH